MNVGAGTIFQLAGASGKINALTGSGIVQPYNVPQATLTIGANGGSGTFSGTIQDNSSPLAILKAGTGTETLSGANTYSGGTFVEAGTLQVESSTALGVSPVQLNDVFTGTQNTSLLTDLSGSTVTNNIIVANQGTGTTTIGTDGGNSAEIFSGNLFLNRATNLQGQNTDRTTYTGVLTGSGTLTVSGSRTTLNGADTFTGNVAINSGSTLQLNNSNALTSANDVTDIGTLRLALGGATFAIGALAGSGAVNGDSGGANSTQTLSIGGDNNSGTFSGVISNDAPADSSLTDVLAIVKAGIGTQTFSGSNTFSGSVTINSGGTLRLNSANSLSSSNDVADNGTLQIAAGGKTITIGCAERHRGRQRRHRRR